MFTALYFMQCITLLQSLFGDIDLSFSGTDDKYKKRKNVFGRCVQKGRVQQTWKEEEYVQRTLLKVGGDVEEKALMLMKASLKMLEPVLLSIKINE